MDNSRMRDWRETAWTLGFLCFFELAFILWLILREPEPIRHQRPPAVGVCTAPAGPPTRSPISRLEIEWDEWIN